MPGDRRGGRPPVLALLGMLALAAPIVLMGWRGGEQAERAQKAAATKPGKKPAGVRTGTGPALPRKGPGDQALPGIVVDTSGAPIEGATVSAELELGPGDRSLATDVEEPPVPVVAIAGA